MLSFCNMLSFSLTDYTGSHTGIELIGKNNQKTVLLSDEMQNGDIQSLSYLHFSHLKPFRYATPHPASQKYRSVFLMRCDSFHHQQSQIKLSSAVGPDLQCSNFWANRNSKKCYDV